MQKEPRPSELLDLLKHGVPQRGYASKKPLSSESEPDSSSFATLTVAQLRDVCRSVGLRTSLKKSELIASLEAYYDDPGNQLCSSSEDALTIPASETDPDSSVEFVSEKKATNLRRNSVGVQNFPLDESLIKAVSSLDISKSPKRQSASPSKAKERRARVKAQEDLDYQLGLKSSELDRVLCGAIYQDKQLHRRILLLEPIPLDEFIGLARRQNITTGTIWRDRARLRAWLDTQGICFYEADLG
ncbi:hypothetical protein MYAM1_002334 [Malassezia yamatoensis]|uniref:Structure-specific endonuclease subunit SLX4 n=1 Tax=Malassezia yamatoensis TaxID=253288 RepID=A0AAJ5YSF4_9BASI|nr:hypothetical protein MYAM1_002334 [Malassezia yamatoensis]